MHPYSKWIPALLLCLVMACSSGGQEEGGEAFGQTGPSTVTIEVNNRNFARATLWWHSRGGRQRLGVVEGNTTDMFTVDRFTVSQPVQIEINLTAGQRCITGELITDPGDQLYLEIAPNFRDTAGCVG